jgi:acetyltransferase-like isoleucine patch superfamily enzyme
LDLTVSEIVNFYAPITRITEQMIKDYTVKIQTNNNRIGLNGLERVGIIGGASGGGALIVIESIMKTGKKRAVCIFDKSPDFLNKEILGIPVVGNSNLINEWFELGKIDSVIIAFNRNLDERKKVFEELYTKGIPFTNIIDYSVDIRSQVNIGVGNIILGHTYIGACSELGNNNFISANVSLEHGNVLGSHCAFGPGVYTSGNVTIGNKIRFATGIFIEPGITIGDNAIIGSGNIITANILEDQIVKQKK